MSDLKICRICLRTEAKVYRFDRFQLVYYYEEVMALKVNVKDGLPHFFCYECATMLHKFHKFKEKCYSGQKVFKELLWKGPITYESIYKIDRKALNLKSPLGILTVEGHPNHVKTFSTIDDAEADYIKGEESDLEGNLNYNSSFADCDDNQEISNDELSISDEKPLIEVQTDGDNDMLIENSEKPLSPTTVFVDDKKEIIILENKPVKQSKARTVALTGNPKMYKFVSTQKQRRPLDNNHWKKYNFSEEEAVKQFRAKAEDPKYLSAAFKCTDCFKWFSKEEMLKRHRHLRHNEAIGPNECRFCHMRFKWDCHMRRHMLQHYTKYECLLCHQLCHIESTALLHEDFHNGFIKKCIHCAEEFRHMSTYYTHMRTHRSEHVCTLCGASFVSDMGLAQHKKLKHVDPHAEIESPDDDEEVNTFCEKCNIRFETRKAYNEHLFHSALHMEGVDYMLKDQHSVPRKILGKRAKKKITIELGKNKNDTQKLPPVKSYRSKKQRRLTKKPMDCHQCGKHFETQAACLKHHQAEHSGTSFFAPSQRHICEICGASLAPGSVAMHQNIHSRAKEYSCDVCQRIFHSSVGLRRHMVSHTGEKPYGCSLCDKRFTQSNSMKLHYRTFHLKQPYPKRNRRKKKDDPPMVAESEESKSCEERDSAPLAPPQQDLQYLTLT